MATVDEDSKDTAQTDDQKGKDGRHVRGGWKTWLLGGAGLVLCAAVGGGVSIGLDRLFPSRDASHTMTFPADSFLRLDEMTVNLDSSDGVLMRLNLHLAVPADQRDAVESQIPRIRDIFMGFLRQVDAGDVRGDAGLYWLRTELLRRARMIVGEEAVREVLIQDLLIR